MLDQLQDWSHGKPKSWRSSHWPAIRAAHLKEELACQVCGTLEKLNLHHIEPVHIAPDKELDPHNLITLCEGKDGGCHLRWGHLFNWKSWNEQVRMDATIWHLKITMRPSS